MNALTIDEPSQAKAGAHGDGFIEGLDPSLVAAARSAARLHAIIARHGSPAALRAAGIPYTQLQRYPS